MAVLVRDMRGKATFSNVEARQEVVLGQILRRMADGLNAYRSKAAGLVQNTEGNGGARRHHDHRGCGCESHGLPQLLCVDALDGGVPQPLEHRPSVVVKLDLADDLVHAARLQVLFRRADETQTGGTPAMFG